MIPDFEKILDIFIENLIPETKKSVNKGNKIFGAFIIKKNDLSLHCMGTNNEISNPLFHGEISTIFNFFNEYKKNPKDYYFVSSHEPCSLCLSAIAWSGFDNFLYFFPYKDTDNQFNIPHDLKILKELFNVKNGNYNSDNYYWKSHSILNEINKINNKNINIMNQKIMIIKEKYQNLSKIYQKNKNNNKIPLN